MRWVARRWGASATGVRTGQCAASVGTAGSTVAVPFQPKRPACEGCPAQHLGKSFVPAEGPHDAKLVLMGQGPGMEEALDGRPFVGRSGRLLDRWLARANIPRHRIAIGNSVWCYLTNPITAKDRAPTHAEATFCRDAHWDAWLQSLPQATVVVAIGVPAMQALMDPRATASFAGDWTTMDGGLRVTGVLHPAHIMRGAWAEEPAQVRYLQRAWAESSRPTTPVAHYPLDVTLEPTLDDLHTFTAKLTPHGIAVDLETAGDHIRLVGIAGIAYPHPTLVLPFRRKGGGSYWESQRELEATVVWLWGLLADPELPKVFQNGAAFDIPMLQRNGFEVAGYEFDTMLAQHAALPEMPAGLEYLAKLYLGAPRWKKFVSDEMEEEGK